MNHNAQSQTNEHLRNAETLSHLREVTTGSGEFSGQRRNVRIDTVSSIAQSYNRQTGIHTEMLAVIKAGQELFGVLKVENKDEKGNFVLSRFMPEGQRGQIVGVMTPEAPEVAEVGREKFRDINQPLDPEVSRNHFSVTISEHGEIIVTDNGSSNGTEVFANFKGGFAPTPELPIGPLRSSNWAPKSAELAEYL